MEFEDQRRRRDSPFNNEMIEILVNREDYFLEFIFDDVINGLRSF